MIRVNKAGEARARELIEHGKISDKPFTFDKADRDALLGPKGTHVSELSMHHLGEDDQAEEGSAKRFRYPMAKDGMVHERALRSICERAECNGHDEVRSTAQDLISMCEESRAKVDDEDDDDDGDEDGGEGDGEDEGVEKERSSNPKLEKRCLMVGLELRSAGAGSQSPGTVVGYAAVFDRFSEDLGYFREKIAPGAFRDCLTQDVRALVNHSPDLLIGRSKSGTLRMKEDELGLRVEIDLPDTQAGRDAATSIRRGDMSGMSFSFETGIDQWDWQSTPPIRTLVSVASLYDVGPVTYPAYTDTSAAMRSFRSHNPANAGPSPADLLSLAKARQQLAEASLLSE